MRSIEPKDVPAGAQIIDVREDFEWEDGHAAGAVHIPMNDIPERYREIDPDREIYLICRSGGRSAQVGMYLQSSLGWDVANIEGGTEAWAEADLPLE